MKSRRLKGVMVGAGQFAAYQAEAWGRIDTVSISAVTDCIADKARSFADRHGIVTAYDSIEQMLDREKPDFVDIATRPDSHLKLVEAAAARSVHVICQKPMARSWAEAVQMVSCCEEAGVRLLIHENWRWQPWYRAAKALLDHGEIGELIQVSFVWRTGDGRGVEPYQTQPYFRSMPMLLVYETLVHLLDTFRYLAGEVSGVQARMTRVNPNITGEDQALVSLEFDSGALGLIDANRITGPFPPPIAMGSLSIEGQRGSIAMTPDGCLSMNLHGSPPRDVPVSIPTDGYKGDSVFATQQHLIHALIEEIPAESEGRHYLRTVALVDACYASANRGSINIPMDGFQIPAK